MRISATGRRQSTLGWLVVLAAAACPGCQGFFDYGTGSGSAVNLRIENGASSFVDVTVTISTADADGTAGDTSPAPAGTDTGPATAGQPLPPAEAVEGSPDGVSPALPATGEDAAVGDGEFVTIGEREPDPPKDDRDRFVKAATVARKSIVLEETVRVSPQAFTDGVLPCADEITVTASIEGGQSTRVVLTGAGTGSVGFDEGSVGLDGERLLLKPVHFNCGDTLVVRVDDSATGEISVVAVGMAVPDPDFADGPAASPDAALLELRVNNQTASFVELQISDEPMGGDGAADPGAETTGSTGTGGDRSTRVRVPPGVLSTGMVSCGPQVVLVGSVVLPAVSVDGADTFNHVVLSGTGTGAISFDENSVGTEAYQRLLLEGTHYGCGDIIQIDFTDDGDPSGETPSVGQASIRLVP